MFNRKSVLTACGAILGLAMTVSASGLVNWDSSHSNHLTFSGPVGLPGVTLPAGTYVFELPSPITSPNLVRVMNKDRSMVYLTSFTLQIARPVGLPHDRLVSFGEAPKDVVPPITVWYPIGESIGHQFLYRSAP